MSTGHNLNQHTTSYGQGGLGGKNFTEILTTIIECLAPADLAGILILGLEGYPF